MGDLVGLRLEYEGQEVIVPEGNIAVIGSDPDATVRIARPGISRRHAVVKNDGHAWVIQDVSSRNGTFHDGARIRSLDVTGSTTINLGHPTDGPAITIGLTNATTRSPANTEPATPSPAPTKPTPAATKVVPVTPQPTPARNTTAPVTQATTNADLDELAAALRDMMKSVRGLTWSVWAMIAVTAVLAVLTLFVGIVGQ